MRSETHNRAAMEIHNQQFLLAKYIVFPQIEMILLDIEEIRQAIILKQGSPLFSTQDRKPLELFTNDA